MAIIEVDFDVWKEINFLRQSEEESAGDVVRRLLTFSKDEPNAEPSPGYEDHWESEGVKFAVGTTLEHRFRDGRVVQAQVTPRGIEQNGTIYSGLSPAGSAITGHAVNGWTFWFFRDETGRLLAADTLRKS